MKTLSPAQFDELSGMAARQAVPNYVGRGIPPDRAPVVDSLFDEGLLSVRYDHPEYEEFFEVNDAGHRAIRAHRAFLNSIT